MNRYKVAFVSLLGVTLGILMFFLISLNFQVNTNEEITKLIALILLCFSFILGFIAAGLNMKKSKKR